MWETDRPGELLALTCNLPCFILFNKFHLWCNANGPTLLLNSLESLSPQIISWRNLKRLPDLTDVDFYSCLVLSNPSQLCKQNTTSMWSCLFCISKLSQKWGKDGVDELARVWHAGRDDSSDIIQWLDDFKDLSVVSLALTVKENWFCGGHLWALYF